MVGERPGQLGKLELDLRKGVLVLAVLSQLRTQQYGYSLRQALGDRGMPIDEGTLHPLPRRLEAQGLLASEWRIDEGPPRRYYRLSDHGTEVYRELTAAWRSLTSVMDHLLTRRVEMYTKGIIETYVDDVVRHVPRRQRNDVGLELRSLLEEELQGRAADAGRPVDEAMTVDMLTAFGHPQDVADRYRPTGFTVIRPADAPRFAWVALSGVALQWAVTLPAAFIGPAQVSIWAYGAEAWWGRLAIWGLSWGLGAFWWPGVLITLTLIGAALSRRRGEEKRWTPRRAVDRDRINRPAIVAALAFWVVGATAMIALVRLADWAPGLPQPFLSAVAFDPGFLRWRALWVLPLWVASLGVYAAVLLAGRWTPGIRRIDLALSVGWLRLIGWWLAGGPILQAEGADGVMKLVLFVLALMIVIDSIATLLRNSVRLRLPAA